MIAVSETPDGKSSADNLNSITGSEDTSTVSSPLSSPKRKLLDALIKDEDCQKSIVTTEITREMSVKIVGNTMKTVFDSILLSDMLGNGLYIEKKGKEGR